MLRNSIHYCRFPQARDIWKTEDLYSSPGPVQFEGPCANLTNFSIRQPAREDLLPERSFGFEVWKSRAFFPKSLEQLSPLQRLRLSAPIPIPLILMDPNAMLIARHKHDFADPQTEAALARAFPIQCRTNKGLVYNVTSGAEQLTRALRIGVLLNGQQAPGVANILVGLWERLSSETPRGKLLGFQGGVKGLMSNPPRYIEITREDLALSRNQVNGMLDVHLSPVCV